jgi:hypothetical protein
MQVISEHNVEWAEQEWGRQSQVAPQALWQEVQPNRNFGPEKLAQGQELITVTLAGGAQVRVGERVLRPLAGQVLRREAGEELEIVNDTLQPLRLLRFQVAAS